MSGDQGGWTAYWEGLAPRHRIFEAEALDLVRRLEPVLADARPRRVLDFGCGFGFVSVGLAARVPELWAWDAAASMRAQASARLATCSNARVVQAGCLDVEAMPRFDLILVNSVIQYMPPATLGEHVRLWAGLLGRGGRVLLSDLPRADASGWSELVELLRFARQEGFLGSAIAGGIAEARRYARMRRERPLHAHSPEAIAGLAGAAGLRARQLPQSLTYRAGRMTVVLEHVVANDAAA